MINNYSNVIQKEVESMKNRKIMKSYRLTALLVECINSAAIEKGVSNTYVVSIALQRYFEQQDDM